MKSALHTEMYGALARLITLWDSPRRTRDAEWFTEGDFTEVRAILAKAAASGIETEGHDAEERHGAEHESPASEAGTPG